MRERRARVRDGDGNRVERERGEREQRSREKVRGEGWRRQLKRKKRKKKKEKDIGLFFFVFSFYIGGWVPTTKIIYPKSDPTRMGWKKSNPYLQKTHLNLTDRCGLGGFLPTPTLSHSQILGKLVGLGGPLLGLGLEPLRVTYGPSKWRVFHTTNSRRPCIALLALLED